MIGLQVKNPQIDLIIFTGVAGAINKDLLKWDLIISDAVIQYDMDATPIFNRFVIPQLGIDKIVCNKNIKLWALKSLKRYQKKKN